MKSKKSNGKDSSAGLFFTLGYEGQTPASFVRCLESNKIKTLIDVRKNAISRKPGFSKSKLIEITEMAGILYMHIPELGVPSDLRQSLSSLSDYWELFSTYETRILPEASSALSAAKHFIVNSRSAIMCFEADVEFCHRKPLSEKLAGETGFDVVHL